MALEIRIHTAIRAIFGSRGPDAAIAALAGRQHGVVARIQLLALGMSAAAIQRRIEAGRLHVVHAGVYAVGHGKLAREGRWMAAVLAAGTDAHLSDASAAALHSFADLEPGTIHVTAAANRERPGIHIHRRRLLSHETTTKYGIPVTTPARTLLDLASRASDAQLERAVREAVFRHQTSLSALGRCLSDHPGHRGAGKLRNAIENVEDAPGRFRSNPEQRFAGWLRKHGFPMPEFNVPMRVGDLDIEADAYWRDHRLVAELDHRGTHAQRQAFESDRIRDRALQAHGLRAIRIAEPYDDALLGDLRRLLSVEPGARAGRRR